MESTQRCYWFSASSATFPLDFQVNDGDEQWESRHYRVDHPGKYAIFDQELIPMTDNSPRILLITDLDGTLIKLNNADAMQASRRFIRFWLQRYFCNGSKLVYSTGRFMREYTPLWDAGVPLLHPDLLLLDTGSDAYRLNGDTGLYEVERDYRELATEEHWDTEIVSRTIDAHFPWLIAPPSDQNTRLKTWRFASSSDLSTHSSSLRSFLSSSVNFPSPRKEIRCLLHISGPPDRRYVEITADSAGKRPGVDFAKQKFGFGSEETVVAGDSGNDLGMFEGEEKAIAPANLQIELQEWMEQHGQHPNKYVSELEFADAIVDGITHFFPC